MTFRDKCIVAKERDNLSIVSVMAKRIDSVLTGNYGAIDAPKIAIDNEVLKKMPQLSPINRINPRPPAGSSS